MRVLYAILETCLLNSWISIKQQTVDRIGVVMLLFHKLLVHAAIFDTQCKFSCILIVVSAAEGLAISHS